MEVRWLRLRFWIGPVVSSSPSLIRWRARTIRSCWAIICCHIQEYFVGLTSFSDMMQIQIYKHPWTYHSPLHIGWMLVGSGLWSVFQALTLQRACEFKNRTTYCSVSALKDAIHYRPSFGLWVETAQKTPFPPLLSSEQNIILWASDIWDEYRMVYSMNWKTHSKC